MPIKKPSPNFSRFDRRALLRSFGAMALAPLAQRCGHGETAPKPIPGISDRIDTVVVLMMENRSFDHYFGALSLEEGRTDVDGLRAEFSNPTTAGDRIGPKRADAFCIADPPHTWNASHAQFDMGRNDGFVR